MRRLLPTIRALNNTPLSLENRAALRTALATLFAILIAFQLHFDKPYWSGMTVVILANIYTGSIIDKAIMRIVGTVIGAWIGFFIAGLVANSLLLYLLINFFLVCAAVYYYNFSDYAYAYLLGALGAFIVISQLAIDPEEAFSVAIWRPVDIGLGVLVSAASAFCLFPNKISDNILKDVVRIFTSLEALLDEIKQGLLTGVLPLKTLIAENLLLKKELRKAAEMIGFMRRELGIKRERIDQFRALIDQFYNLTRSITYFLSAFEREGKEAFLTGISAELIAVFEAFNHDLHHLKEAFFIPQTVAPALQIKTALLNLEHAIDQSLGSTEFKISSSYELMQFLERVSQLINNLEPVFLSHQTLASPKKHLISSQKQLRNDPDNIIHSIKVGLAAILALSFWLVSNWPGGLNGIISSIIISIRKNLFEMTNISLYRILGCFAGGGLALFSLSFVAMNLYDFMLLLFFAIWGFSYFSFKYTDYAYIGLQANIALVMTLAQAGGPPTDLAPPLERLAGIFIGIVASFLVANLIWRRDLFTMLFRNLEKLQHFLFHNLSVLLLDKTEKLYDLRHLFWLCRSLIEAINPEHLKANKQESLTAAKRRFEQMAIMQAAISHIDESINKELAGRLALTLGFDFFDIEQAIIRLYKTKGWQEKELIKQHIEASFAKIDFKPYYQTIPNAELINCLSYINSLKQLVTLAFPIAQESPISSLGKIGHNKEAWWV